MFVFAMFVPEATCYNHPFFHAVIRGAQRRRPEAGEWSPLWNLLSKLNSLSLHGKDHPGNKLI